jgi:putative FmdB family regulatory protein
VPRWDYACKHCGYVDTNVTLSNWREATNHVIICPRCGDRMERVPCAPNFTVKGYNAHNSYGVKK